MEELGTLIRYYCLRRARPDRKLVAGKADWSGVVQRAAVGDSAALEEEEKRVVALEAELAAAESRVEAAEARYALARKQVKEEMAEPLKEKGSKVLLAGMGLPEVEARLPSDDIYVERASTGTKNTSARSEKEVNRDKWLANRSAEVRVWEKAKKAKDMLRRNARDKKTAYIEDQHMDGEEEAPEPQMPDPSPTVPRENDPLWESDEIKQGAKSLAERLVSLRGRPDTPEKKAGLLKVLTGGREYYYTSEPIEVLSDLETRGLVVVSLANELREVLKKDADAGGREGPLPPQEWLSHAQKVSDIECKDEQPFKESEDQYLKWIDRRNVVTAEMELDAAEAQLEDLLRQVDACIPAAATEEQELEEVWNRRAPPGAEQEIDEDYADQLESMHDPERQSKGSKNTSALSQKVVSREKWLAARGTENRERQHELKARDSRRGEARDRKVGSADVGDDDE